MIFFALSSTVYSWQLGNLFDVEKGVPDGGPSRMPYHISLVGVSYFIDS